MGYQYGYFKPLALMKAGKLVAFRQLVPPLFVAGLLLSGVSSIINKLFLGPFWLILGSYLAVNLAFSLRLAAQKGIAVFLPVSLAFAALHFSYGIGYLRGVFRFMLLKKHTKTKTGDVPLTR